MTDRSTVQDLLREIAYLSGEQREQFLAALPEDQRHQINSELAAESPTVDLDVSSSATDATTMLPPKEEKKSKSKRSDSDIPEMIGPYRIMQPIGLGGMGQVFMAQQFEPIKRRVALKIIKTETPSREILARFDAERQALAMMDHQNIAKVLDAGITSDGRPYFAMELVHGIPITSFCDKHRLGPRDRLELFVQTCRAIQHAHQKGIIHRDIKPSNVLVTEKEDRPVVKVIDFGLAKALQDQTALTNQTIFTQYGQIVGTLEYMSPEQAELNKLDIDTRSDVYSLGVILFELLTGSTPLGRERVKSQAYDQILRLIREEDVPRMVSRITESSHEISAILEKRNTGSRRLCSLLRGDVQWIAMKSLEKDRTRRYEGAGALADDVQRHLDDEPIDARPPTLAYRVHKAYRKHKAGFVTACVVALLLVAGLVGTGTMWIRAESAANRASLAKRNALVEAQNARDAEADVRRSATLIEKERDRAMTAEVEAVAAKKKVESTLARSSYLFAFARWDAGRVREALELLHKVPESYRQFEWYLAHRRFSGGDITLYGHTSTVADVAYSSDGQYLVSAGFDRTVRIWDPMTGRLIKTLEGHTSKVTSVCYSPDGSLIASGSADNTIRLWNRRSNQATVLKGHTGPINRVCFSPDGSQIASASWDRSIKLWNTESGELLETLKGHDGEVLDLSFSPNGSLIASCSRDNTIRLWDASDGSGKQTLKGHPDRVTSIAFSPLGDQLASASYDRTVRLWDVQTGDLTRTIKDHTGHVTSVLFSPDGARLVSATDNFRQPGTIRIWDARTGKLISKLKGHQQGVTRLAISPDGSRIASGSGYGENTIKLWDARSGNENRMLKGHNDRINAIAFSPDGRRIASAGADPAIMLWDTRAASHLSTLRGHARAVTSVAFSNKGSLLASGSDDQTVKLWDAETGKLLKTLEGPAASVSSVSFSHDDRLVAAGSWDKSVTLWDISSGEVYVTLQGHSSGVLAIAFSPDSSLLATAGGYRDEAINIWDTQSAEITQSFQGHANHITSVCFAPDSSILASASADGSVKTWDVASGELLRTFNRHTNRVDDVAFSPDGSRLASASYDNTVRLWDTANGDELRTISGHSNYVTSVAFSPDGQTLASAGWDKTVKLWHGTVERELRVLRGHSDSITGFAFSPDSALVATASNDQSIKLWVTSNGSLVQTLIGHNDKVSSIAFDRSGSRIYSEAADGQRIAWNTATGQPIDDLDQWPDNTDGQSSYSPDGRWLVLVLGDEANLVDLDFKNNPREKAYRHSKGGFDSYWHLESATLAEIDKQWYEALFHRAWVVKQDPTSNEAHWRMRMVISKLRDTDPQVLERLPVDIAEAIATPAPPLNEQYAATFNFTILKLVAFPEHDPITDVSLQEMLDICEKYPKGSFFHTLGIAQYRAGDYRAALNTLSKSLVMMPDEFNLDGPHPGDLAFLAMCHQRLEEFDMANDFRDELAACVENKSFGRGELHQLARRFLIEVDELFAAESSD